MHNSTLLPSAGFGDRLLSETKKLAPKDIKIKVRYHAAVIVGPHSPQISAPQERTLTTWIG